MGFSASGLVYGLAALTSAAVGVHQGQQQHRAQKRGLNMQATAQKQAESIAMRQQKEAAAAQAAANRKAPDLAEIMAGEEELARLSASSTTLTSPGRTQPKPPASTFGGS